ncbi:MAG: hypothetical protein SPH68_08430 [Candidatus Borkfalkiaceae bacterium]|nr:hypothetical protein [Clostridia bacterium]MDY6224166.1 hypothetical protein [Christensenellaceae bacterium]
MISSGVSVAFFISSATTTYVLSPITWYSTRSMGRLLVLVSFSVILISLSLISITQNGRK